MKKIVLIIAMAISFRSGIAQSNVGIGENNPASKLSVKGGLSVGSGYSTTTAPADGAIIQGGVGIGTSAPASTKAVLDVSSSSKGVFIPRMTTAQRTALTNTPLTLNDDGLLIYNTDVSRAQYWDGSSLSWKDIGNGVGGGAPGGIAGGSLTGTYPNPGIATGAVTTTQILDQTITNADILDGTINLGTKVTNVLPVTNGGTGRNSLDLNSVIVGNNASGVKMISPNTTADLLMANGLGVPTFTPMTGDATISNSGLIALKNTGTANTYGSATQVPVLTTDAQGRVTGVTNTTITGTAPGGAAGGDLTGTYPNPTVSAGMITYAKIQNVGANKILGNPAGAAAAPAEISLGPGLSFSGTTLNTTNNGTVTGVTGTAPIAVTGTAAPVVSIANAAADGSTKGAATFTAADFNDNGGGNVSLDYANGQKATTSQPGFLTNTDWNTFNNKPGGSGTANSIPKWTASSTLGNSQITDNGTVVGIGSTNTNNKLQVNGSIGVFDDAQSTDSRYLGGTIEKGWTISTGAVSYPSVTDAPMGNVVAQATGFTWAYGPRITLDITKDYLVEGWVRATGGTPAVWYFCVQNYDNTGANISGDGSDWNYPVNGGTPSTTWTKYNFIVGPNGVKNHSASAKYISVGWIANYTTGNATYQFCGWRIKPYDKPVTSSGATFTAGSVIFAGTNGQLAQNNASAFWDNTNGRLGIGTNSPAYKLDVQGTIHTTGDIVADGNYGQGLVGLYSATRYENVFSMGAAYRLAADGTTPGNLYGIAWTHSNIGGQSKPGLQHQALFMLNGVTQTAVGTGVWTNGTVTAPELDIASGAVINIQLNQCGGACGSYHQLGAWTNVGAYGYAWSLNENTAPDVFSHNGTGTITVAKTGTYMIKLYSMAIPANGPQPWVVQCVPFINGGADGTPSGGNNQLHHGYHPAGWWDQEVSTFTRNLSAGTTISYGYYPVDVLSYWAIDGYTGLEVIRIN